MATFQINAAHVSRPRVVGKDSVVTIRPAAGATAIVEYTTGTSADIANNAASWRLWPKGNATTTTSDQMNNNGFIRVTAINGNVSYDISEQVSGTDAASFRADWQSAIGASGAPTLSGQFVVGGSVKAQMPPDVFATLQFTRTLRAPPYTKSNLGAAIVGVNSATYSPILAGDAIYNIGCDASAHVSSSVKAEIYVPPVTVPSSLRTSGTMRLVGTQNQVAEPAPSATAQSNSNIIKVQAPSGAIGARVTIYNKASLLGCTSYKVSIAPTDIAAIDTVANAYNAQVAGVVNNVTASGANPLGFVKATWKGAAQSRRIFPSNAQLPSFGYNNQEDSVTSDLIPLIPKRATDRVGEEYYFIVRSNFTVAVGENIGTCVATVLQGMATEWTNTNGADAPLFQSGFVSTDAVDGAYTIPASMGSQGNTPVLAISWEYPPGVAPTTFWHVGDSITEGYQWPRWAVNRKSTAARPLHHVNLGGSTTRTESFIGNMYLNLQSMAKPDYVVMPILSINNYSPQTDYVMDRAIEEFIRLQEIAAYLNGLGIKIIWWTPFNFGANPVTPGDVSTPWNYLYTNAKTYAAANSITFMDINGDPRFVRSVYNASTNPTGWIDPDNTHPSNPTGKNGFAAVYTDTLAALGF